MFYLNRYMLAGHTRTYSIVGARPPNTGTVSQTHIHFDQEHVAGGIIVFLRTNLGNGPSSGPATGMPGE
jgi:hypothetical protein